MSDRSNDAHNKVLEKRALADEDGNAADQQGYMCLNAIGKQEIKTELPDANAVDTTNAEAPATKVLQPESGLGPSAEALTEQQSGALPTEETTGRTKVDGLSPTAGTAPMPEPAHPQQEVEKKLRSYGPKDLVKLFIPISLCMLIVVLCVRHLETFKRLRTIHQRYMPNILMEEDTSAVAATASYTVAYFMMLLVVVTFAVVLLFYLKCYIVILIFIVIASLNVLIFLSSAIYYRILRELDVPVSAVLFLFALYNLVVVQMMSIFWKGPKKVQQASLVIFSAVVALTILEILPYWITWILLVVLSVWDLIAVLTPCGPLRLLIILAQKRKHDIMPALLYTGSLTFSNDETSETRLLAGGKTGSMESAENPPPLVGNEREKQSNPNAEEEKRNVRLGLGDFVFYSLLVGTATMHADWTTTLACYVAILTGLGFTLILLAVLQRALPALPISIAFGMIAFFGSKFVMSDLVLEFNKRIILI